MIFMSNNVSYFGTNKENLTWELSEDGKLMITGMGQMEHFNEESPAPWNDYKDSIHDVIITGTGAGIKEIPNGLFEAYPKLAKISTEKVAKIGDSAFAYCPKLQSVSLGSGVSFIGNNAFSNCSLLRSVDIAEREGNNKRIVVGNNAFHSCQYLDTVSLPDGMLGSDIAFNAFSKCSKLCNLRLGPLFDSDTFQISTDTSPDLSVVQEPKVVVGYSDSPVMQAFRDKCGVSFDNIPHNSPFYPGISMHVAGANALLFELNEMAKAEGKEYTVNIKTEWINGKAHVFPGGDKPYLEYKLGTEHFMKLSDAFFNAKGIEPFGRNMVTYMNNHLKLSVDDKKQVQSITGEKVSIRQLMTECRSSKSHSVAEKKREKVSNVVR